MRESDAEYAERLRKEWGDKPCDCTHKKQEHLLGMGTGDYYCIQCGKWYTAEDLRNK